MTDQLAVILAAFSAFGLGIGDYLGSRATKLASPLTALHAQLSVAFILSLGLLLIFGGDIVGRDIALGVIAGIVAAVSIGAFYKGFAISSASVVAAFTAVAAAVTPIAIDIGWGRTVEAGVFVGASLATASLVLVTWSNDFEGRVVLGACLGVITGIGLAISLAMLNGTTDNASMWPLAAQRFAAVACTGGAILVVKPQRFVTPAAKRFGYSAAVIGASGLTLLLVAAQSGPLAPVAIAGAMFPAVTITLSSLIEGPRLSTGQVVGVVGVFLGVLIVILA